MKVGKKRLARCQLLPSPLWPQRAGSGPLPTHVAADNFCYVYQTIAATGPGIAAIAPDD